VVRIKPKNLDLALLRELLGPLFLGTVFFSLLFLMFQIVRLAERFIQQSAPLPVLAEILGLMTLTFSPVVLPVAFLLAVLLAFGRLSADSELVAWKASGVSMHRMMIPIMLVGILTAWLSLTLNLSWVPKAERQMKATLTSLLNTKAVSAIKAGTFTTGFFDLLIYAEKVDNDSNRIFNVFIYDERNESNPITIVAKEGEIIPLLEDSAIGTSAALKLYSGTIHSQKVAEARFDRVDFKTYQMVLKIAAGEMNNSLKPKHMAYGELRARMLATKDRAELLELKAEFWRRLAIATMPLVFVFLGMGFGTLRTRAVRASAVFITIATFVPYYMIQAVVTKTISLGYLPPIAMLLPNFVISIGAWRGYRSALW